MNISALGYTLAELTEYFTKTCGKGAWHAKVLFRRIYTHGDAEVAQFSEKGFSRGLAQKIDRKFHVSLPPIVQKSSDGQTCKYTLGFKDGRQSESVLITMDGWSTLCVSSQVGCARGCVFCRTGRMGLHRNLTAAEIMAQWAVCRFVLGTSPRNIVFMGMGEPFDNFDQVIKAIRILSDTRGVAIPKRRISISTAGHVAGLRSLVDLDTRYPDEAWRSLHLSISVNAANDELRSQIMPINRQWPLMDLKKAILETPQASRKDGLYFEYVLIPGLNDSIECAKELSDWAAGLEGKFNLIPYHDVDGDFPNYRDKGALLNFQSILIGDGWECRIRQSKGKGIKAACGMLGASGMPED